jgi:D-arabinose 1-dehydrogenase-like Zn-dependent alcohol dehydrogenase
VRYGLKWRNEIAAGFANAGVQSVDKLNTLFAAQHVAGPFIGGIAETQEMLDFCGRHGITIG